MTEFKVSYRFRGQHCITGGVRLITFGDKNGSISKRLKRIGELATENGWEITSIEISGYPELANGWVVKHPSQDIEESNVILKLIRHINNKFRN